MFIILCSYDTFSFQYEQELSSLRQQLAVTQAMLAEAQAKLMSQESSPAESEWAAEQKGSTENFEKIIDR